MGRKNRIRRQSRKMCHLMILPFRMRQTRWEYRMPCVLNRSSGGKSRRYGGSRNQENRRKGLMDRLLFLTERAAEGKNQKKNWFRSLQVWERKSSFRRQQIQKTKHQYSPKTM